MASPKIKTFADLKGKTVALEEFSVSHFVLVTALAKNGMSLGDVKVTNLTAGDAAAAFLAGRVDAAVVWNPWVNQIQASGKGKPLFTSKDMPGLIPDLLVAQEKAIKEKRKDFLGMIRAWYDTVAFIQSKPDEAAAIMSKVVGLKPEEYTVFLPGPKFFGEKEVLAAMDEKNSSSLIAVTPTISKFLLDNKLMEGRADFAKGIDASLVQEAAKR